MLDNRHVRHFGHGADQGFTPARNHEIDPAVELDQLLDRFAVGRTDKLNRMLGQSLLTATLDQGLGDSRIRVHGLLATTQNHRVGGLEAEHRAVSRHVGA